MNSLRTWRHWSVLAKVGTGIAVMVLIVIAPDLYGSATSSSRIDASLEQAGGPVNLEVELDFRPQPFHQNQLRRLGIFAGNVDGRVKLMRVSPANLDRLKKTYWIKHISASDG